MCRHLTFVTVLLVCQSVFAQSGSENQPVEASPQQIEALADNEGGELDPGHVRMPVAKTVEAMRQALTESTCIVYEFDGEEATEMFRALDDQGKAKLAEAILRSLEGNDAAAGVEHGLGAIGSISALVLSYPGESWNRSGRYIPQIVAQLERQSAERKTVADNQRLQELLGDSTVNAAQATSSQTRIVKVQHIDAGEAIRLLDSLGMLGTELVAVESPQGDAIIFRHAGNVSVQPAPIDEAIALIEQIDAPVSSAPRSELHSKPEPSQTESSPKTDIPDSARSVIRDYYAVLHEYQRKSSELGDSHADVLSLRSELAVLQARYVVSVQLLSSQVVGGRVKVESQKETLTILLKGPENDVRMLQRLIDMSALPNIIPKQDNSPAKSLSDLQQAYEQAEREAAKLAEQFQLPPHQGPLRSDGKPSLPIDTKLLMEKIEVAFDLSMQLQQAQLAEAEANLKLARERLARREQIKDKIIARRVEELTSSDDTSWQGTQTIERTLR